MDKAEKTMIENLHKNTGKTLEQWISIVKKKSFQKHGEIITFLKGEYNFTHGFANLVALKARAADAGSVENKDDLVAKQYMGKEHFLPIYEKLINEVKKFGSDVEIAPKNNSVSLRRKKQFALLLPATKTRFEIGINLKGQQAKGKLEEVKASNAMCSHKISISKINEADPEVIEWMKKAYQEAG